MNDQYSAETRDRARQDYQPDARLRLTLLAPDPTCRPAKLSVLVGEEPFRIGRASDNDWILPPDRISRHQALIRYVRGIHFVENLSATCPLAVGSPDSVVAQGDCQTLVPGSPFWIDDLKFATEVIGPSVTMAAAADSPLGEHAQKPSPPPRDPLAILIGMLEPQPDIGCPAIAVPQGALHEDWWQAPEAASEEEGSPPDTDAARVLLCAFCEGAELEPAHLELTPDRARQLGAVLRATVSGVLQLVQARRAVKNELGLNLTRIHARANNPFRVTNDEARLLEKLFAAPAQGYLPAERALEDVFAELLHHQIALIEALRRAFDHLLQQLDPATLANDSDVARPGWFARLRGAPDPAWQHYQALHERWLSDPDWAYRRLLGDMLARSYETQSTKLRRMRGLAGSAAAAKKEKTAHA